MDRFHNRFLQDRDRSIEFSCFLVYSLWCECLIPPIPNTIIYCKFLHFEVKSEEGFEPHWLLIESIWETQLRTSTKAWMWSSLVWRDWSMRIDSPQLQKCIISSVSIKAHTPPPSASTYFIMKGNTDEGKFKAYPPDFPTRFWPDDKAVPRNPLDTRWLSWRRMSMYNYLQNGLCPYKRSPVLSNFFPSTSGYAEQDGLKMAMWDQTNPTSGSYQAQRKPTQHISSISRWRVKRQGILVWLN